MKIDEWLLDILACPQCHAPLHADDEASELVCTNTECRLAYPVRDDIPVLLIDEARRPGEEPGRGGELRPGEEPGRGGEPEPAEGNGPAARRPAGEGG